MKKRILVVDEHDLLRVGVAAVLAERTDCSVHETLVRPAQAAHQVAALSPALVVIDPYVDESDGPAALADVRERHPATPLLVLTAKCSHRYISRALQLRINGYLPKTAPAADLLYAVDSVLAGKTFLHPDISHALIHADVAASQGQASLALTARQEQVLRMIADGKTTRQIAAKLGLSAKTVEFHRVMLMNRLGIHHVPGLVRYAMRYGYMSGAEAFSEA